MVVTKVQLLSPPLVLGLNFESGSVFGRGHLKRYPCFRKAALKFKLGEQIHPSKTIRDRCVFQTDPNRVGPLEKWA